MIIEEDYTNVIESSELIFLIAASIVSFMSKPNELTTKVRKLRLFSTRPNIPLTVTPLQSLMSISVKYTQWFAMLLNDASVRRLFSDRLIDVSIRQSFTIS